MKIKFYYLDGTREIRYRNEDGIATSIRARDDGTLEVDDLTVALLEQAGHLFEPITEAVALTEED